MRDVMWSASIDPVFRRLQRVDVAYVCSCFVLKINSFTDEHGGSKELYWRAATLSGVQRRVGLMHGLAGDVHPSKVLNANKVFTRSVAEGSANLNNQNGHDGKHGAGKHDADAMVQYSRWRHLANDK